MVILVLFLFAPIVTVEHAESGIQATLSIIDTDSNGKIGIRSEWGSAQDVFTTNFTPLVLANTALPIVLLALVIFKFNDRKYQMRWSKIAIFIQAVLSILTLIYLFTAEPASEIQKNYLMSFGAFMPVLAILFTYLGFKGVKRDDDLIKSADRIR